MIVRNLFAMNLAPRVPLLLLVFSALTGCQLSNVKRDPLQSARELNTKGTIAKDPAEARRLFEQATRADPLYGPAYHNLGVSYLNDADYYHAAIAFDQARKLMPANPVPRIDLGVVYEKGGQLEKALEQYAQALQMAPTNIEALQALTRCQVRQGQANTEIQDRLKRISTDGTSEDWRSWARQELTHYQAPAQTKP
jgi:tetratricopeptide (TPR) repeat protein